MNNLPRSCLLGLFFGVFFGWNFPAQAAQFSPARAFFLSPQSLILSGEAPLRSLEKGWQKDQFQFSYLVEKDRRQFWLKGQDILRDIHLSQFLVSNRNQKNYRVIRFSQASVLAEETQSKSQEWLTLTEVTPSPSDLGIAMNLVPTPLRKSADWKSDASIQIPSLTRLKIVDIQDSWIQVEVISEPLLKGFVDLNNVVLKSDFAQFAMTSDKKWQAVRYREGKKLTLKDGQQISVKNLIGLVTQPDLAISTTTSDQHRLFMRQNLKILKTEAEIWAESNLKGHGTVFWKKQQTAAPSQSHSSSLNNDQILKMEISSVTFHPKAAHLGVVSAQGVYLTKDGTTWDKISLFGNQSHPVHFDDSGVLFVGPYRSYDYGKTFQPAFRWENLTSILESQLKKAVQNMKLVSLSTPVKDQLHIEVQAAGKKLRLAGRLSSEPISHWDFVSK